VRRLGFAVALVLIVSCPGQDEAEVLFGADDAAFGDPATLVDGLKPPDDRSSSLLSQ